ncbi:tRNA (adenosine(37)-N6)-threonylcarbamoyltransferase complex transferase subunit TsaD [Clostridiales bacterium F-3ap]|uniref:tRNA N6-adenosine threonylcarbamoyltransferase n=2 Tax=Anaerotalea alkaliphila TaxID=2662126 RepID=A0A7X5HVX5_9FIRM|nr:tRNA (adenosine(37)-N6)-threonylcarbamoyltransferase complex transferase subunit TsaD [Anaerotalea alkaliphila]NDL67630.1 tRNA (adenosine(37)-N6)-threonylcarbamoyltransferase complex transferase subunit TsaD [Anaerotalea alkaliphila]
MQEETIRILAIETSCDETSAAVVENGTRILSNVISSQIDLHKKFGGVVPELASRKHMEKMDPVIQEALEQAGTTFRDLDAVAVTYGPGLVGALLVGVSEAKAMAYAMGKPLIGIHHIEGHISANYIEHPDLKPPFLCLVVSGGHTHLVHVKDYGHYGVIGKTRDDAIGEAFDKVARAIGLGYPGGPAIDRIAREGNPDAIRFPRAFMEDGPYDFSFSGVKSAVLNYLNQAKMRGETVVVADVAASFQKAAVEVLVKKTMKAAKNHGFDTIALAGGVAANSWLRESLGAACKEAGIGFHHPSMLFCTDNAAMIGTAAYHAYRQGVRHGLDLNAVPDLKLPE